MTTCLSCNHDVEIEKKRDKTIRVTLQADGSALDITGASIWFSVKGDLSDEDDDALITKSNAAAGGSDTEANVVDGTSGILEIYIVPADTEDLDAGDYWYDVVIQTTAPRKLQAVDPSRFSIRQPVTLT